MAQSPLELMKEALPHAVELRRVLHRRPELAFAETETTALIRRELESDGIELLPQLLPTGAVALLRGGAPGKTILVREDIDALPMTENTALAFSSEKAGVCHSCGHDIHTAGLLLLAKTLQQVRTSLRGNVLFLFQPAEETASGAKAMYAAGLGGIIPTPDAVVGFHVQPTLPVGTIGLIKGVANASTDEVRIRVRGAGGHAAHPYRCADPVAAAGYLLTQLQTVVSRENPALRPAVLTFGMIHGGTAPNIIPTEVELAGTLRAFDEESRRRMFGAIRRISEHCCAAMRAEASVEIREGVPVLANDPDIADALAKASSAVLGADSVRWVEKPSPGSDDFSCFLQCAPGVQFGAGTANADPFSSLGLHNPQNVFDEGVLYSAPAVLLQYILDTLA